MSLRTNYKKKITSMENFISVQLTKRNIDPITHDFAHQFHLKTLKRGFVSAIKEYIRIPIKILIEYKLSLQLMILLKDDPVPLPFVDSLFFNNCFQYSFTRIQLSTLYIS